MNEQQLWWNIQFSSCFLGFFVVFLHCQVPQCDLVIRTWCCKHGAIRRMPFNRCDGSCVVFEHCNRHTTEKKDNINNVEQSVTLKSSTFFVMIAKQSILLDTKIPPIPPHHEKINLETTLRWWCRSKYRWLVKANFKWMILPVIKAT